MCLLCDDEKAYAAYMAYLDAMEQQQGKADPDKALDAVLADIMKPDAGKPEPTLSPKFSSFSCDPVDE